MSFKCKECGSNEDHHAKGFCSKCYHKLWFREYYSKPDVREHKRVYEKNWRKNNSQRVKEAKTKWGKENKNKIYLMGVKYRTKKGEELKKKKREYSARPEVKKRRRESEYSTLYYKKKSKDPTWRMNHNMGIEIWRDLKTNKKHMNWEKLVGYKKEELIKHLETQFTKEMNWDNYGTYWEIDHFLPRSQLKFTSYNDSNFKVCWSLWNLRPLKISENRSKGNRR